MFNDAFDYLMDRSQRSVLLLDILRKRGNTYLDHLRSGQPPVLIFDYEMVMDGRTFEKPVNYSLLRILDRRNEPVNQAAKTGEGSGNRRNPAEKKQQIKSRRPIVVIDPRAGHGPGIGGSKVNSQIGVALDRGHPVYFITFYTHPESRQTLSDVHNAEIRFLEEVGNRHPDAPKPAVIGNCQAGWAAALIGADRPNIVGPLVLSGSPLSYWAGVAGANPMRYKGGLNGGVWLNSLWCDLGNGHFDGANLVAGFEDLNPANTYWNKLYHVFTHVDTEADRFLDFEKWWGGFFKMNAEEIHFIVDSLFIGNELEKGYLRLEADRTINLKNINKPILVFASGGDNITPPSQALGWIKKVYGSVTELKNHAQVIVYMVHETIGHLGIFVSGNVARKEHREIIGFIDRVEYLSPGLYEMVLEKGGGLPEDDGYEVRFEARTMDDISKYDDGLEDEAAFSPVSSLSRFNDTVYKTIFRPWVKKGVSEPMAEMIRQLHPLRAQRYGISDLNPFVLPVKWWSESIRKQRQPLEKENPYAEIETSISNAITSGLNCFRDVRDTTIEFCFKSMYDNPMMKWMFGEPPEQEKEPGSVDKKTRKRRKAWIKMAAVEGGFAEAVVRIFLALTGASKGHDKRRIKAAEKITKTNARLKHLSPEHYKIIVKEQARLLDLDREAAIKGLKDLLPVKEDRAEAIFIAHRFAKANQVLDKDEKRILTNIQRTLGVLATIG